MIDFQPQWKSRLTASLGSDPAVVAIWEGGARATGFADEYSDLDKMIVIQGNGTKRIFEKIEEMLAAEYGIKSGIIFPELALHGLSQQFYLLDPSPALFYVDITVTSVDSPDKFTEIERHGRSVLWFDRQGMCLEKHFGDDEIALLVRQVYAQATEKDFHTIGEAQKAIVRQDQTAPIMSSAVCSAVPHPTDEYQLSSCQGRFWHQIYRAGISRRPSEVGKRIVV